MDLFCPKWTFQIDPVFKGPSNLYFWLVASGSKKQERTEPHTHTHTHTKKKIKKIKKNGAIKRNQPSEEKKKKLAKTGVKRKGIKFWQKI